MALALLEVLRIWVFQPEQLPAPSPTPGQLLRHFIVPQGQCIRNREGTQSLSQLPLQAQLLSPDTMLCLVHSEADQAKTSEFGAKKGILKGQARSVFLGGTSGKEPACQCRRHGKCRLDPWVWEIP